MCDVTVRRVRVAVLTVEKQKVLNIMSALVSGMHISSFVRRIILSSVACLSLPYFPTLSHKRYEFRKKKNYRTYNVCFDLNYSFCPNHFTF